MNETTEYLGQGRQPDEPDGRHEEYDEPLPRDERRRTRYDLAYRGAVVVLLAIIAATSLGGFLMDRQQYGEYDEVNCFNLDNVGGGDDGRAEAEQRMAEIWDCD